MPNYRLVLEYDGSFFQGWHPQKNHNSIYETLLEAINVVLPLPITKLCASGRTDAGVHAKKQIANFFYPDLIDCRAFSLSLSILLRDKIAVLDAQIVPDTFHSRFSALSKTYSYQILNRAAPPVLNRGRVWHMPTKINLEKMEQESKFLLGEHDFSSFRAAQCGAISPIKKINSIEFQKELDLIVIKINGSGFLKQMVRNIVGTLVEISLEEGRLSGVSIQKILEAKDRKAAGRTAPAEGLYLEEVFYE